MDSMEKVLETEEQTPAPNKKKFAAMIAIGFMAAASAGMFLSGNKSSETAEVKPEVTQAAPTVEAAKSTNTVIEPNVIKTEVPTPELAKTINPVFGESKLITNANRDKIEKAGQFTLPNGLKDNQVARQVAQIKFKTQDYFQSLVSECEGFRSGVYNDNIGFAFGNGWNISMQKASYNTELAKAVSNDGAWIQKVTALSGKISSAPVTGYDVKITPQRSMQVAQLMGDDFQKGVINGIAKQMAKNKTTIALNKSTGQSYNTLATNLYQSLAPNEQAAVLYHSYKVGEAGFAKYTGMIDELITYGTAKERTPEMAKKVAEHMTYKYKMNGEVKQDLRAEAIIQSMFFNLEAFGYLIGKNVAPKNMASFVPSIKKNNIDLSAAPGQVKLLDPVGETREKLEREGQKIEIKPDFTDLIKLSKDASQAPPVNRKFFM